MYKLSKLEVYLLTDNEIDGKIATEKALKEQKLEGVVIEVCSADVDIELTEKSNFEYEKTMKTYTNYFEDSPIVIVDGKAYTRNELRYFIEKAWQYHELI